MFQDMICLQLINLGQFQKFQRCKDSRCFCSHFPCFNAFFPNFAAKYVKIVDDIVVGFTSKDKKRVVQMFNPFI